MENSEKKPFSSLEEAGTEILTTPEGDISDRRDDGDDYAAYVEYTNAHGGDDVNIITTDNSYDEDMWETDIQPEEPEKGALGKKVIRQIFDFVEMLACVTVGIIVCFSIIFRLNIVDGPSMENTLHTGEYLIVSDILYTPKTGDIVVVHDITMEGYTDPIVKRVIATEGQVVDIDFKTWTVKVDGEILDEVSYRYLDGRTNPNNYISFPITVGEGEVFVMGDNRNHSADSRLPEIGTIDKRCIVGKVYARIFPFEKFTLFKNPFEN